MSKLTRQRRKDRARYKVKSLSSRFRLSVFISHQHIHTQIIDDVNGNTVASASTVEKAFNAKSSRNKEAATLIGQSIAARAKTTGVTALVFDRGVRKYHPGGKLDLIATAVREGGILI
jgi:large subunit ribosomal protein L18